jgi:hypothetical protein
MVNVEWENPMRNVDVEWDEESAISSGFCVLSSELVISGGKQLSFQRSALSFQLSIPHFTFKIRSSVCSLQVCSLSI